MEQYHKMLFGQHLLKNWEHTRMIILKSHDEMLIMEEAGQIVAEVVARVIEATKPGATTLDLDDVAQVWIKKLGATPTFVGYMGYPKSLCVSLNDEVVHGIPAKRIINEGDVVSIDCGVTYKGFVADHARTIIVGKGIEADAKLVKDTEEALNIGIEAFKIGNRIGDIGFAIEQYANERHYGVVKDFVGHGIGRRMHEEPQVPNFGKAGTGPRIKVGMVIAIEPMFNLGTENVKILKDGWTVITKDGKKSAHFEHTIAMFADGPRVLTRKQ